MGLFSFIGDVLSSAVDIVTSVVGAIGSAISTMAPKLLEVAGKWLGPVAQIVQAVAVILGILKPEENVEELGAKAMQAEQKPEDFDSYAKYIEYLRNEVELDKEKFEKASDSEKLARTAIGSSIAIKGIEEKKGFEIPLDTWISLAKLNFENKEKEVDAILDTFKGEGLEDFNKYTKGELSSEKELEVGDTLVEMYQNLEPNASPEDIEKKVMQMEIKE